MSENLVKKDIIFNDCLFDDQEVFFRNAAATLENKGYVTGSFYEAIKKREKNYPTGLQLENLSIAIPHTDPENVVESFVAVYKLIKPIEFIQMATDDKKIKSEVVLILGIKDPKEQVGLLSQIIELFSNKGFVKRLKKADKKELYELFKIL
ncbi:PTS galactitol transporter subunit IIA [Tetragenococcus halophilus subsp. flandriensis]|uniref:PTS sugar transporter subunit IIA n=1 Tax=Tetragenococcus halophilus TaxID=51669 RepID=UPI0023E96839|nr:PTS sugar transporter subunit IIA [Tetragenococcus halophilus]GMA08748.1 PTS galactitol transporter subunit IIA [Tetragenococcus halophilus subsp. flandriensis]